METTIHVNYMCICAHNNNKCDRDLVLPLFTFIFDQNGMHRIHGGNRVIVFGCQIQIFKTFVWLFGIFPSDSEQRFYFFGQTDTCTTVARNVNLCEIVNCFIYFFFSIIFSLNVRCLKENNPFTYSWHLEGSS